MLTTPTIASITGAMQVQETVKLLHGLEVPSGKGIYYNGQTYRTSLISYTRREDCCSHDTYEKIVELNAGVNDLSVGALLEKAAEYTGNEPVLLLDQEIVQTFFCPNCNKVENVCRPFETVVPAQVRCLECDINRIPNVSARLAQNSTVKDIPLKQIGIPLFHVVQVETTCHRVCFELKGDKSLVFKGWEK